VLGPVYFIFTSKLPRRLVRRGFSFNHSEIEKGVFAAIRRASFAAWADDFQASCWHVPEGYQTSKRTGSPGPSFSASLTFCGYSLTRLSANFPAHTWPSRKGIVGVWVWPTSLLATHLLRRKANCYPRFRLSQML